MGKRQTMTGCDCTKGKPCCRKSKGGAAGPAGWTGSNKTLLQHEVSISSTKINEQKSPCATDVKALLLNLQKKWAKTQSWLFFSASTDIHCPIRGKSG